MTSHAKKPPSDEARWVSLYPAYINAKKTQREGRRISKQKAVDTPTCQEMLDILKNAGLNVRAEKKMYPRDQNRDYQFQGRLRIQLKEEDGKLCNENYPTRESLMFYLADTIPKLKTRQQRSGSTAPSESTQQQQPKGAVAAAGGAGGGKKKKR